MKLRLIQEIEQQNPWLNKTTSQIHTLVHYRQRVQLETLLLPDWADLWTILIGPRRSGKTTLGKYLCQTLLDTKKYDQVLYLNCDLEEIREWLKSPLFIKEAMDQFNLKSPIIFIDEVQRLSSPGLLLKTISDLNLPIKKIASGSSQLELKSKVQEHLTGRQFSSLVLPLSWREWDAEKHIEELLVYGAYPQIVDMKAKELMLAQLYDDYIHRDIIETLKIGQPDNFKKLLGLVAHSSGQLVNFTQLSTDCQMSQQSVKNYLSIAQQTYVIAEITPFVGNKRTELTSNPIFYFIDNGFRNHAIRNFTGLDNRSDYGLLVESLVYQELYKYITQNFLGYSLHYWRTKSGAEVDFIVKKNEDSFLPIEVKYKNIKKPKIERGYRSFLSAYQPKHGIVITKDLVAREKIENTEIFFIPLSRLGNLFPHIDKL